MSYEQGSNVAKKAMAYDLITLPEEKPEQTAYSVREIKKLIKTYISTLTGN